MEERVRAIAIGVPAWAARKRSIEDDEARFVKSLVELHDKLVRKGKSPIEVESALVSTATALDLTKVNKRVADHNRYYPIEANLPMNRHGMYTVYGKEWLPEQPYTPQRLLALARTVIGSR